MTTKVKLPKPSPGAKAFLVRKDTGAAEYELHEYDRDSCRALVQHLKPVWTIMPLETEWFRQRYKMVKIEE